MKQQYKKKFNNVNIYYTNKKQIDWIKKRFILVKYL